MDNHFHPYYPQELLLAGYVANEWTVTKLISCFAAAWVFILGTTLIIASKANPNLRVTDQVLVLWFVLTGLIHCCFESYFVYNHLRMSSRTDFFGQLWKEYALSDSRYMSADPLVLVMESWTVTIWGPLSLITALFIIRESAYRHPFQALVSTGHVYGNLLYMSTSMYEEFEFEKSYYRPEPFYFWVYFVGMNAIWFVVPGWCLFSSIRETKKAFALGRKMTGIIDASRHVKKTT